MQVVKLSRRMRKMLFATAGLITSLGALHSFADSHIYQLGAMLPLTGPVAPYGEIVRQAIVREQSPHVRWVFEDDACDAAKAVSAYRYLHDTQRVPFLIGPACGSPQQAIAPIAAAHGSIVVFPNAVPKDVLRSGRGWMFAVQYDVEDEAAFLAQEMNRRGLRRVAVVATDNHFSRAVERGFLEVFKGEVVFSQFAPDGTNQHIKTAALKLKTLDFDAILLADIGPLVAGFLTELQKLGVPRRLAFTNYGAQIPDVLTAEGANAEGLLYAYPAVPKESEAYGYFAGLAARVLSEAVTECKGEVDCVRHALEVKTADLSKQEKIVLKQIRNGSFEMAE